MSLYLENTGGKISVHTETITHGFTGFSLPPTVQFPFKLEHLIHALNAGLFFKDESHEKLFSTQYTDKKENKIFPIYKEIQMGSVANVEVLPNI